MRLRGSRLSLSLSTRTGMYLFGSDRKNLRIGYFLWWFSFLFVGLGVFDLSTRRGYVTVSAR